MRLRKLSMLSNDLQAQIEFYHELLQFEMINQSPGSVAFKIGEDTLRFVLSSRAKTYHFAFNVPFSTIDQNLQWLRSRLPIIKHQTNEIQNFESWQARAIYFFDGNQNIVEWIGRAPLDHMTNQSIGTASVHSISEIGIVTNDLEAVKANLNESLALPIFKGHSERFCAMGDDAGLFICIDKNKKTWFPTGQQAELADFQALVELDQKTLLVNYLNGVLSVAKGVTTS